MTPSGRTNTPPPMRPDTQRKLDELQTDYAQETGEPFEHFYCPIVHEDEDVPLCRGHVVPQAFEGSDRTWTVQREDVDNLFGTLFESGFEVLQEDKRSVLDVLSDKTLSGKLPVDVSVAGEKIDHFRPDGPVPDQFSPITLADGKNTVDLALKIEPSELMAKRDSEWEIGYEKDVRLDAIPSLLKAAHLTLFELLGYQYACSLGGRFLGETILGEYVEANLPLDDREQQRQNARAHFAEFASLVRPVERKRGEMKGTITDNILKLCGPPMNPWAFLVLVRTGDMLHGVLVPRLEDDETAAKFCRFLESPFPKLRMRWTRLEEDRWESSPSTFLADWPETQGI